MAIIKKSLEFYDIWTKYYFFDRKVLNLVLPLKPNNRLLIAMYGKLIDQ